MNSQGLQVLDERYGGGCWEKMVVLVSKSIYCSFPFIRLQRQARRTSSHMQHQPQLPKTALIHVEQSLCRLAIDTFLT